MTNDETRERPRAWVILHLENGINARGFGCYGEPNPTSRLRELQCPIAWAAGDTYSEARARAIFAAAWRIVLLGQSIRHVFQTSGKVYAEALDAADAARDLERYDEVMDEFVARHSGSAKAVAS